MPDYQSAYWGNYSCKTSLLRVTNDVLWAMKHKQVTAMIKMDLSVAFDRADHNILLEVLNKKFGIEGTPLQWFTSYLRPRSCKVNISLNYSNEKQLQFSIPLGSCAGPTAYIAYASTMREIPSLSKPTPEEQIALDGFADDHSVKKEFTPAKWEDELKCIHDLEHCMGEVQGWMEENRLKLNSDKTEFILFSLRKMLSKCITTNVVVITPLDDNKCLD